MRVLAVDWSGAVQGEQRLIWLAEAAADGERLLRLEAGRSREELVAHLVAELPPGTPAVVGLDFAFARARLVRGAARRAHGGRAVGARGRRRRAVAARRRAARGGAGRASGGPTLPSHLRLTELALPPAKSVFQVGGTGAVGTGSVRGMPLLLRPAAGRLRDLAVPRRRLAARRRDLPASLHAPVRKSSAGARAAYLESFHPALDAAHAR